jgi:hypothetical protein
MRNIVLLLCMLALTDCAISPETVYLRTDGQDIASNPALREQLDRDRMVCLGDLDENRDCMAVKGYVSVRKDQAATKQQQIAAQNAGEAVAALPPPIPAKRRKTVTAKKQKSTLPEITLRPSQD